MELVERRQGHPRDRSLPQAGLPQHALDPGNEVTDAVLFEDGDLAVHVRLSWSRVGRGDGEAATFQAEAASFSAGSCADRAVIVRCSFHAVSAMAERGADGAGKPCRRS